MGNTNIKMIGHSATGIAEMADILKRELDAELVNESQRHLGDAIVILLTLERYFFRNGNYASLTVMLTECEGVQTADIIGSGGGSGFLNLSWGANAKLTKMAQKALQGCGLQTA